MELTPLGFKKPISSDSADLRVFVGDNMELLDSLLSNKQSKIYKQSTAPSSPLFNDLWIDTSSSPFTFKTYDGSSWNLVGGTNFVEDANHRYATDAEKNAWNAKADAAATTAALNNKVDVVSGKGLSSNDYTTAEKDKLASLSNYTNQTVLNALSDSDGSLYYKGVPIVSGGGSVVLAPDYVVKDSWNTTGTRTLPVGNNYKFYINNTGNADLTFTINGITFTVKSTEEFEDIFDPFTQVIVTATSTFDANVSGLKSGSSLPIYSVKDYFAGSANTTRSFSGSVYGIVISNDGLSALTYAVNGLTLKVEAGNVVERYFDAFTEVTINSTVAYRVYITSALNAVVTGSTIADTTAPNNVANLNASSVTATTLTLSWNASTSNDVASYDIYNGATLLGNTSSLNFNVTGLAEKTQYTFYVKAKDSSGNVASGTPYTTTTADVTAPANPTNLTTASVLQTTLTLNWIGSVSSDVASYDVYNGATLIGNVTGTTYSVTGLTAGTNYTFNVKAKDASNNASGSATVSIITIPSDVTGLTTSNLTSTSLTVNWFASTGAASYDVYNGATLLGNTNTNSYNVSGLTQNTQYTFKVVAKNASGSSAGVTTIATTSSTTVNPVTSLSAGTATINSIPITWVASTSTIANQEISYSTDGGTNYSTPVTISSSATSYTVTGLSAGTTYTIRVVAIDASANRSVPTTVQRATAAAVSYTVSASPAAGTYGSTQNVTLSCAPTGATIYYTVNGSTPTTSSSVYSSSISVSSTQTIKFFAQDAVGNLTAVQTANYTIDTVAPSPAISPTAGTPTSSTIPISWTLSPSSDVANYEVAYSTDNFVSNTVIASSVINSSSTSYTVTGLAGSTPYTLRVVAIDGAGNRSTGVTVQATTAVAGITSVTSGMIHSYDLRGGSGYIGTVADTVGAMPLTLTNFKTDGTEGFITGGLKHAGALDVTSGAGHAINTTVANLGMATGSSFTVIMKASLNPSNYNTNFFATSKDNGGVQLDGTPANTVGRFQIGTTSVGATKVHAKLLVRDSSSANTIITRDDATTLDSTVPNGASPTPAVYQVTYDATTKTVSLYLNGSLNKSAVLTNHMKFDSINLCSGQKVDHALLIYNRVLSGSELTQVSTDLLALS